MSLPDNQLHVADFRPTDGTEAGGGQSPDAFPVSSPHHPLGRTLLLCVTKAGGWALGCDGNGAQCGLATTQRVAQTRKRNRAPTVTSTP